MPETYTQTYTLKDRLLAPIFMLFGASICLVSLIIFAPVLLFGNLRKILTYRKWYRTDYIGLEEYHLALEQRMASLSFIIHMFSELLESVIGVPVALIGIFFPKVLARYEKIMDCLTKRLLRF